MHEYGFLYCNVWILCIWNFGIFHDHFLKIKDALNEWNMNMNLLCYELFKIQKIAIILQVLLRIKNDYVLEVTTFKIKKNVL